MSGADLLAVGIVVAGIMFLCGVAGLAAYTLALRRMKPKEDRDRDAA